MFNLHLYQSKRCFVECIHVVGCEKLNKTFYHKKKYSRYIIAFPHFFLFFPFIFLQTVYYYSLFFMLFTMFVCFFHSFFFSLQSFAIPFFTVTFLYWYSFWLFSLLFSNENMRKREGGGREVGRKKKKCSFIVHNKYTHIWTCCLYNLGLVFICSVQLKCGMQQHSFRLMFSRAYFRFWFYLHKISNENKNESTMALLLL